MSPSRSAPRPSSSRGDDMKGLIYPLTALAVLAILVFIVSYFVVATAKYREAAAIRNAQWKPYTTVVGDGTIEVGVEHVAHWGEHVKVLKREKVALVKSTDMGGMLDAQGVAEMRAGTYNSL